MRRARHMTLIQPPRRGLAGLLTLALLAAAAAILLALVLALLAIAAVAAAVIGAAWIGWVLLRGGGGSPTRERVPAAEVKGLLRIAATSEPMEQYLLAVEEFERISGAAVALRPEEAGQRRAARRAAALADQAFNLHDAVSDIERRLLADPYAAGVRAHVWELSLAARESAEYLTDLAAVRRTPSLGTLRGLVRHRAALVSRREALVERLSSADVTRTLAPKA